MKQFSLLILFLFVFLLPLHSTNDAGFFIDITQQSNLNFVHDPHVGGKYFFPEVMGSGCALFDYDNDNDL
ncbi:hypothetical protein L0244_00505, partial [bacterium]|nr:hypothetical protein [bacterium]